MYCKKCGCKISVGEKRCSDCGEIVKDIEYSGGFWGLVGEERKRMPLSPALDEPEKAVVFNKKEVADVKRQEIIAAEREQRINALQKSNVELTAAAKRETKQKNKYQSLTKLLCVFAAILLVICLIQTVRVSIIQTKYETIEQKYQNLNTKYETLAQNYQELNTKCETLEQRLDQTSEQTLEQNYQDLNTKYKD